jgi:ABC-type uncharacterized transport system substrate-binding protein
MNRREFMKAPGGQQLGRSGPVHNGALSYSVSVGSVQVPQVRRVSSIKPEVSLRDCVNGWIEGKDVVFEQRYAENRLDRLPELAAELVRLKVDIIVATGTLAPLAAKQVNSTIPIVMAPAGDPLGSGLVSSLAHPGGNVTGLSLMVLDLGGKRLELLKELLPGLSRVAVLWNAANPHAANVFRETERAARKLGIENPIP